MQPVKQSIFSAYPKRNNKLICYTFNKLIEWNTNYEHVGDTIFMCLDNDTLASHI